MKLISLEIDRYPSYDANHEQLRGHVVIGDNKTEHKIILSPTELVQVIQAVSHTVGVRAIQGAREVEEGLSSIGNEVLLLLQDGDLSA